MARKLLRALVVALVLTYALLLAGCWVLRRPTFGTLPDLTTGSASPERLEADTRFLTDEIVPRGADHPANLARAAEYIAAELRPSTDRVELQSYDVRGEAFHNVVATYGPVDGAVLVVGAHYDAFTAFGPNPGADDNASGTAGLIELGRLLGQARPQLQVQLVAFTLEEPPHFASPQMGSRVHADLLHEAGTDIWGMICLEMIGYFTDEQPWPSWLLDFAYPDRGDFVAVVGRFEDQPLIRHVKEAFRGASAVPIYGFNGPRDMGIDASDHRSFWYHDVSAVMVTDTAFARNPRYHTPTDTADSLDYERMAEVVDGVLNAVLQAAPRR